MHDLIYRGWFNNFEYFLAYLRMYKINILTIIVKITLNTITYVNIKEDFRKYLIE